MSGQIRLYAKTENLDLPDISLSAGQGMQDSTNHLNWVDGEGSERFDTLTWKKKALDLHSEKFD